MTKIKRYKEINEEFIGTLLKGAMGKLFSFFTQPFKDLVNDIKKSYKEGDPNSIKNLIIDKLNKAIDGVQKGLADKSVDEASVKDMMNQFIIKLTELANGMTSDFEKALGKDKSGAPATIAKTILIGNKELGWSGIIGLLNRPDYKYSKVSYEKTIADAGKAQTGPNALKAKKDTAIKFFDAFQKDFVVRLQKDFTDDEIKDLFNKVNGPNKSVEYKEGDMVKYKRDGYNNSMKPEEQKDKIAEGEVKKVEDDKVTIFNSKIKMNITKPKTDVLGKVDEEGVGPNAKNAKEVLGAIKGDEEKMGQVVKFAQFISDDNNKAKMPEIEKIIGSQK